MYQRLLRLIWTVYMVMPALFMLLPKSKGCEFGKADFFNYAFGCNVFFSSNFWMFFYFYYICLNIQEQFHIPFSVHATSFIFP